jgi:hypothetical protein
MTGIDGDTVVELESFGDYMQNEGADDPPEIDSFISEASLVWGELMTLAEMVEQRSPEEGLAFVKVLHEVAKLHVAEQLPYPCAWYQHKVAESTNLEGYLFRDRNITTVHRLFKSLGLVQEVDDDGIPLGMPKLS